MSLKIKALLWVSRSLAFLVRLLWSKGSVFFYFAFLLRGAGIQPQKWLAVEGGVSGSSAAELLAAAELAVPTSAGSHAEALVAKPPWHRENSHSLTAMGSSSIRAPELTEKRTFQRRAMSVREKQRGGSEQGSLTSAKRACNLPSVIIRVTAINWRCRLASNTRHIKPLAAVPSNA